MSRQEPSHKLRAIYQLLFHTAVGNRSPIFESTASGDELDYLLATLSSAAERLRELLLSQGKVPPLYECLPLTQFLFVLDATHTIVDCCNRVTVRLKYTPEAIRGIPFVNLLEVSSKSEWSKLLAERRLPRKSELLFALAGNSKLPLLCCVADSAFSNLLFVVAVEVQLQEALFVTDSTLPNSSHTSAALAEKVHTYILEHLDEPLPSARSLALLLDSEEHALRKAFREHYATSIYQFFQEERLRKSRLLILHTVLPLKEIAFQCGFETYLNFYKAFRKRYGIPPSVLERKPF